MTTTEENTIEIDVYEEIYDLTVTVTDLGNINLITKALVRLRHFILFFVKLHLPALIVFMCSLYDE